MIVVPKVKGFICTTAHPLGCTQNILDQISYVKKYGSQNLGHKKVLVIGASTGFGLATRIQLSFGYQFSTIGIIFEKEPGPARTATAGYYNTAAFEAEAQKAGIFSRSVNMDAFSKECKDKVVDLIKTEWGGVDLLIYSLASPRRTDPSTGITYKATLKTIGEELKSKTINSQTGEIYPTTIPAATDEDIEGTIKVMGGEDWKLWIDTLQSAGLLNQGFQTIAYSYIGPKLTQTIYRQGSIGQAKNHLEKTGLQLNQELKKIGGSAYVSVNKALVTQSSTAIPVMSLYITLLYKTMRDLQCHEGCIEQIVRLFNTKYFVENGPILDEENRLRVDDWELRDDVQKDVEHKFAISSTENINQIANVEDFNNEFLKLFGFGVPGVDYSLDVNIEPPVKFIS